MKQLLFHILSVIFFVTALASCKSSQKISRSKEKTTTSATQTNLKEQRKIDYLYMEAVRLKNAEKSDAAFDMFTRCLEIDSLHAPSMYELSAFYMNINQFKKAKELLRKANQLDSSNKWYKWRLVEALLSTREISEPIPLLEELSVDAENKLAILEILISLYTRNEEYDKAIETLNKLEKEVGINEAISTNKFELYIALQKEKEAFKEIDKLQQEYPDELHYQILEGDLYISLGKKEEAQAIYDKVEQLDPNFSELIISKAKAKSINNIPNIEDIKTIVANEEINPNIKVEFMQRYLFSLSKESTPEQYTTCDSLFIYLIEKYPLDLSVKGLYSDFLRNNGRIDESVAQIENMVELNPENEKGWSIIVDHYVKNKSYGKLSQIAQKAIMAMPQKALFWFYLGAAYAQEEKVDEALKTLQEGIENCKNDGKNILIISEMYGQMGDLYQKKEEKEKAIESYETALKYNDKNISVLNNYSYYLSCLREDLKKAEWMSGKCIELEPNNPTFLDTYAWIYFIQGNYSLALFYIERAFSKGVENNAEVIEHYGDILYMNGQKEKAVEQWEKALKLESKSSLLPEKIKTKTYIE